MRQVVGRVFAARLMLISALGDRLASNQAWMTPNEKRSESKALTLTIRPR
jgi:hypothetical protein